MDIMRLIEAEAGFVCEALLKREAVTLPVLILNHTGDFDCNLVFDSTSLACSSDTHIEEDSQQEIGEYNLKQMVPPRIK